jgi:hypothetical protein
MVAHTRPGIGLLVTFTRDDEQIETITAPTSERALQGALMILARLDGLEVGDKLIVTEAHQEAPQ